MTQALFRKKRGIADPQRSAKKSKTGDTNADSMAHPVGGTVSSDDSVGDCGYPLDDEISEDHT